MIKQLLLILFIGITNPIHSSLTKDTLIKFENTLAVVESLSKQNPVASFDLINNTTSTNQIIHIFKQSTRVIYQISVPTSTITCTSDQLFYDPLLKLWISAKDITNQNKFLASNGNFIPCLNIEKLEFEESVPVYDITLEEPHTFFISKAEILTHNFVPIIIGLSWTIGEGIALSGAGIGIGALGLGFWQKFGNHKKITFAQIHQECMNSSSGSSPDPDDKKRKINTISKTEFFEKIKDQYDHIQDNVYKKKTNCDGINNAEYLEWDALHNDVEAYNKRKIHLGSIDPEKMNFYKEAVKNRRLNL